MTLRSSHPASVSASWKTQVDTAAQQVVAGWAQTTHCPFLLHGMPSSMTQLDASGTYYGVPPFSMHVAEPLSLIPSAARASFQSIG